MDDVAKFARDLDAKGKSTSTIENHLKPISQTFRYAMCRGLISVNPVGLTPEDGYERRVQMKAHEWSDAEVASVFTTAATLAEPKRARADHTLLGLQGQDVDFEERVVVV